MKLKSAKGPRLGGLPRLILKPGTQAFDYRGTTRGAYEEIGKQFGVKMVFDGDLPDRAVRFQVPTLDFDTAVMVLSRQTKTFTRVVDAHTMFVTEDTPQKEREYTLEVEKELLLPAAVSTDEMNEAVRMIREMTGISRTQLNTAARTLTVRSTEQNVALAQTLLEQIEQPHGELMLDIEILELDRTTANQLGITPPTSSSVFALTLPEIQQLQASQNNGTLIQTLQSIFGSSAVSSASGSALPALIAFGGGKTIFLATMPSVTANFGTALNTVHSAQRILLRAQDGKPATFFVGDRYPIDLGLLSSDLSHAQRGDRGSAPFRRDASANRLRHGQRPCLGCHRDVQLKKWRPYRSGGREPDGRDDFDPGWKWRRHVCSATDSLHRSVLHCAPGGDDDHGHNQCEPLGYRHGRFQQ